MQLNKSKYTTICTQNALTLAIIKEVINPKESNNINILTKQQHQRMQKEAKKQLGIIGATILLPISSLAANNNYVEATCVAGSLMPKTESVVYSTQQVKHQQISGKVFDESGEPVIGATIALKNNPKKSTVTDVEGNFTLNVNSSNGSIMVSYIGFQTQEVKFSGNKVLDIHLKEDSQTLGDVVVTAFGATQKKETVVGSVQQVKPEALRVPSASISSSFAGRLSGVIATQSSGQPGANGSDFYIRGIATISGAKSPLIVMDGMEISQDDLNHLDPDVIESFSILKDASATAMYGSQIGRAHV